MKNFYLILIVILIIALPLIIFQSGDFGGTDDKAITAIQTINSDYKPWFTGVKLFESGEIVSLFFCLQTALGAGVIGYYVGYYKGKQNIQK